MRRLVGRLAALVAVTGGLTIAVGAALGPTAVEVIFGAEYRVSRGASLLVAAGTAAYLVASVANDVAVALGEHRRVGPAWVGGIVAGALVAAAVPGLLLRSTLPLLVGSAVAAAVLLPIVYRRCRGGAHP